MGTFVLQGEPPFTLGGLQSSAALGSGGVVRLHLSFAQKGELLALEIEMPVSVALSLAEQVRGAANAALR